MPVQEVGELPELKSVRRAILVVDLVESVRLIQDHEADVIDRWRRFVSEVRTQVIAPRAGRMVRHLGDGMLLEFEDPHLAMGAALDIQHAMQRYNVGRDAAACMHLRVGAHLTEIKVDELDIFGPGVNLVARLAGLAAPGAIVCSAEFKEALVPWLDAEFEDLGDCWLKHIDRPVRAYRAATPAAALTTPLPRPEALSALLPRVAVLDLMAEGCPEALGSLMADEIAALLCVNGSVEVVSRMSTRSRGRPHRDPPVLLRHLRAPYGLCGSCTQMGGQLVLRLELLRTETGSVLWSEALRSPAAQLLAAPG